MLDNTGLFVTDDLNNIVDPVTNATFVFLTTDGQLYAFNGAGYDVITGGGAGSGITTLTGDVTAGPGSGSQAATIAAAAVTLAKIANAAANSKLVGSGASGSGSSYSEITLGTNLSMSGTTLNAATGGGGGALTLIEKKTITSNTTTVTFSGLDGNTDGVYLLQGRVFNNSGSTADITLQPNGISTNQRSSFAFWDSTTPGIQVSSNLRVANITNTKQACIVVTFFAKDDPNSQAARRYFTGNFVTEFGDIAQAVIAGQWLETATNITSIDVVSSQTNGLGNGTELALYKYSQS